MEILGYEKKEAVRFIIKFKDQQMDVKKWQENYFKLISWKNTWGGAYKLDVNSNKTEGTFIVFVVAKAYSKTMEEWLEELGFNYMAYEVTVGEIELDYDEGIEDYVLY